MTKRIFSCLLVLFGATQVIAQSDKDKWVDSVFHSLNTGRKIGQLFMVPVSSEMSDADLRDIEGKVKSNQVGSLIFTGTNLVRQAGITNQLQSEADLPLLIGENIEWGLRVNADTLLRCPPALLLGAVRNDSLVSVFAHQVALQMKALGLHMNFATVTPNAAGTFIDYRSLGENKVRATDKALVFTKALQDQHIITCTENFTVKGITVTDIQKGWPSIQPSLDSAQAYPFLKLFHQGIAGTVLAPGEFPLFYQNMNLAKKNEYNATVLSSIFTGRWLKKKTNFSGLAFADMRNAQSLQDKLKEGETEMRAFMAGNDVLMYPQDIGAAVRRIRRLVRKEKIYEHQLDSTVKRILAMKYDAGLWRKQRAETQGLLTKLNSKEVQLLHQKLQFAAVTVLQNKNNTLPIRSLDNKRFAYITAVGPQANNEFYRYLTRYVHAAHYTVDDSTDFVTLSNALKNREVIMVGIFPETPVALIDRIYRIVQQHPSADVILCDFGNEYFLKTASQFACSITAYANTPEMLKIIPEVIFGGIRADGILPFNCSGPLQAGTGFTTERIDRLIYTTPEDAGMDSRVLTRIDSIANEAVKNAATPGCQVLVARNGKVVYDKTFGYQAYDKKTEVTDQTIYDLASLTKVSATLQAVMFMHEKGLIDIYKKASVYLPELKQSNKKDITILEMLTHQAGLVPFIPLWPQTMKDSVFLPEYYSFTRSASYPLQVSPGLYASSALKDSVWTWIIKSKMAEKPPRTPYPYRYSDLGFMILQHLAERILNQPLEDFLEQNFYEPLGAYTTGFNPLDRFAQQSIAPTENDRIYRKAMVVGTVHDERAAMLGGVSGHAGLFSTANDLAKLAQMLLQEGHYGGYQYYKPETIRLFRAKQFDKSRRGLGWDKPIQSDWNSPTSLSASPETFGHTGFTGTCMWVDPEFNLVYIFLSNRVYPDRNTKLLNTNVRTRIQDVIYQSIFNYCGTAQ